MLQILFVMKLIFQMKLIKINKQYRNGEKIHYLFFSDSEVTDGHIESEVERWCDEDPNGLNYGYTFDWSVVQDPSEIKMALTYKINVTNLEINNLQKERFDMQIYIAQTK